jgi:hypothetical protein
MGKAKGTGEDKAVDVGDDYLATERQWKRIPVHVSDGGPIGAIWVKEWTEDRQPMVSIRGRFTGSVDMQDEFVFSPKKGEDSEAPTTQDWAFDKCTVSDAPKADIEIDFGIFKRDKLFGGRKANTNEWYVHSKILERKNLTLRPVDDETLDVNNTFKKVVLGRVGPAALVTKGQVSILEHGFETRPHPISTAWGGNIKYWTIKKGESGPFAGAAVQNLDAFPSSLAFNQSFEVSPHVGIAANTSPPAENPNAYNFFVADVFKPIASGTKVYFTHKVYAFDQNGSLHIGYFLDDTTAASPALKWYANTVIPYPLGGHVLNPYYGHRFAYAGGRKSVNLPAGYYAVTTPSVTYPG